MKKAKSIGAVHPPAALEAAYRKKLDRLIARMQIDLVREIKRQYRAKPPEMAEDVSPAKELEALMRRLSAYWQSDFNELAPEMARYFAQNAASSNDRAIRGILRRHGFTVKFKMTAAQNDIIQATTAENVMLIKSIASQHLDQVQGLVMRSVTAGRDLGTLSSELSHRFAVTRRRAALIARDQNNKATSALQANRQIELGLMAIWLHSAGGKEPRPSHVANSGNKYDPAKGWFDPDERKWIRPGELIGCRCVSGIALPKYLKAA